jgi:hypothetical protein
MVLVLPVAFPNPHKIKINFELILGLAPRIKPLGIYSVLRSGRSTSTGALMTNLNHGITEQELLLYFLHLKAPPITLLRTFYQKVTVF